MALRLKITRLVDSPLRDHRIDPCRSYPELAESIAREEKWSLPGLRDGHEGK